VFSRLADLAHGHPRRVVLVTVVFVLVAGAFGGPVAGLLSGGSSNFEDSSSESVRASELLEEAADESAGIPLVALVETPGGVRSEEARARVESVAEVIAADPVVARVLSFYETNDPAFVSLDEKATYLAVKFKDVPEGEAEDGAERIEDALAGEPSVKLGGGIIAGPQVGEQVAEDLTRAELFAFPILFVLSVFVFRGLVAALLPIVAGMIAIVGAFLALRLVNEATPLSIFALNLVTGMGLGLAIDYSLFIVSRYREELARSGPGREAIGRTLATAGRTVLYSALTVAVALAGLLVFPQPFLYSMGIGGILVALISAAVALVFLPTVLALLGTRVNSLTLDRWRRAAERTARETEAGFWYRLSQFVMRRPGPIAATSAALLIVLGLPFLRVEFTGVDASVLPQSASARQVSDALAFEFPSDRTSPIYLVVEAPASAGGQIEAYARLLRALPGAAAVSLPRLLGDSVWRIDVISRDTALADSSKELVEAIRDRDAPFDVLVGGETARFLDQLESLGSHLPLGLGILAAGTLLLLFAMTGSVVLPVKALVMNLLTLSAAFGILVLVFQDGNLEGVLDFTSQGALEATQPILLFAVAFALSTDYAVFLLTRIKEARDSGLSNTEAVALGLERTGRIVTAAALLFTIAIGAFSTSEIVFIKLLGVGTAAAVILDATIVRALLVPSLMKLLGRWNWWAPEPLRRAHARLGLGEGRY